MTNIPEGWKLVPVEPTEAMLSTAEREMRCIKVVRPDVEHIHTLYRAMLFTAPQPPAQTEPCRYCGGTKGHWEGCQAPDYATSLQPPAQPVKRLTDAQISEIEDGFSNEFGLEAKHSTDFARAIETACAAAWGVKLED